MAGVSRLPGPEDLETDAILSLLGCADRVGVECLGMSRAGRRIPLLTIGDGPSSALIVGAPHPNEPTGCLTILRMLDRLAKEPVPGWQWHFIPAIDIDGLALNEGWFSDSPDLETYLAHFYRPPFRLQPEYGFPIELPGYEFSAETPETRCWRAALDIAQPRLQCSLHGADTGGSFFILSTEAPELAAELAGLPSRFGFSLNEIGEPLAEMTTHRPGVFSFPDVAQILARGQQTEAASGWNAGDSSAGFAARRLGTFSMSCEVPLWRDAREGDSSPSGRWMSEVIDERVQHLRQDLALVAESLPALNPRVGTLEQRALVESLEDSVSTGAGVLCALQAVRPRGLDDRELSKSELVAFEGGTYGLRVPAMLARLAKAVDDVAVDGFARALLEERLAAHRRSTRLTPVSLPRAAELQMHAVQAAASYLSDRV